MGWICPSTAACRLSDGRISVSAYANALTEPIERGHPQATSEAILNLVDAGNPPLRLGLGTTILSRARAAYQKRIATWEAWEDVTNAAMGQPKILGTL